MEPREVLGRIVTRLSEVPWPCAVCGAGRDFDDIAQVKRLVPIVGTRTNMELYVHYCKDRPTCEAGAEREAAEREAAERAARLGRPRFICPACGTRCDNPNDVAAKYCFRCHWWTGDPFLGPARPELFERNGRTPPRMPGLPPGTGRGFVPSSPKATRVTPSGQGSRATLRWWSSWTRSRRKRSGS